MHDAIAMIANHKMDTPLMNTTATAIAWVSPMFFWFLGDYAEILFLKFLAIVVPIILLLAYALDFLESKPFASKLPQTGNDE